MRKIALQDKEYPALLKEIAQAPKQLYVRGVPESLKNAYEQKVPIVAIVGSRRATSYGMEMAFMLARDLALEGAIIVSGLAMGIDAQAHRGALGGGGTTWAVLGSGIENIQPAINRKLAEDILRNNGLVISEYGGKANATKWTFPERNRIIAGLSQATIIVEAAERSGALITARLALDANRDVGAVPGEARSINSKGTHSLLKEGAALIQDAGDVLELLGVEKKKPNLDKIDEIEHHILHSLAAPKTADELGDLIQCSMQELNIHLSALEIAGAIKNKDGLFYKI
ncbi:MAG: DNA-protecting protein DprA [Candidatus Niyogibacteria bacterium]|nr:DNA-protecting protein DprA [Candidatus Niyogibacteria bacterium]